MVKCHQPAQDEGVRDEAAREDGPAPHGCGDDADDVGVGGPLLLGDPAGGFRLDEPLALAALAAAEPPDPLEALTTTSASSYSIYKQRIDSMFDETRSVLSYGYGTTTSSAPPRPPPPPSLHRLDAIAKSADSSQSRKGANNVVQARIEKMFAEMSNGGSTRNGSGALAAVGCHRFSVDYLGSVPLTDKVTTLRGLQQPLRDLYLGYRRALGHGQSQGRCWEPGFLEISGSGLRVHHSERGCGQLEQLNPFPTIAVWAAVQFMCRDVRDAPQGVGMECAFLPLIADPDGVDKEALFRSLSPGEEKVIRASGQGVGVGGGVGGEKVVDAERQPEDAEEAHHAPLFAVVMRKMGVSRQLECHGFVCSSEEDAIVMAANLYQALTASMKAGSAAAAQQEASKTPGSNTGSGRAGGARRGPVVARMHHENGIGRVSIAGSICGDPATDSSSLTAFGGSAESSCSNPSPEEPVPAPVAVPVPAPCKRRPLEPPPPHPKASLLGAMPGPPKVPPPVPKRPPRKKKSSGSSAASDDCEDLIILEDPQSERPPVKAHHLHQPSPATVSSLRGNFLNGEGGSGSGGRGGRGAERESGRRRGAGTKPAEADTGHSGSGDILTKVAIPRSHSFLNANGPLTRYGRRQPAGAMRTGVNVDSACGRANGGEGGRVGGSPLGFNELFTEFRQQEGLDSLDDILDAIIDAEGMSFNDLKPIYKEFLLKLALTLTKDELFQRSKSIMRRQRKKQMGRALGRGRTGVGKRGLVVTAVYIKRAVRRSISKLRPSNCSRKRKLPLVDFSSLFQSTTSSKTKKRSKKKKSSSVPLKANLGRTAPTSANSTSMSSYPSSNFRMSNKKPSISVIQGLDNACSVNVNVNINNSNTNRNNSNNNISNNNISNKTRLPRRRSSRRRSHQSSLPIGTSTSEDSDFFTMIRCDSRAAAGSLSGGGGSGPSTGKGLLATGRRSGHSSGKTTGRSGGGGGGNPNRSSSGYVSCSDCSYDSESCTCTSAERCYCSMARSDHPRHHAGRPAGPPAVARHAPGPGVICGCDTDSCRGSDKCYCSWARCCHRQQQQPSQPQVAKNHHSRRQRRASVAVCPVDDSSGGSPPANIFEQLKQQGFAASDSSLSRAESPLTAWRNNESRVSAHAQQRHPRKHRASSSAGSMRSSRSLEFLQMRPLLPQHQYPAAPAAPAALQPQQHAYCSRMDMYRSTEQEHYHHRYGSHSSSRSLVKHNGRLLGRPPSRASSRAPDEELLLGDTTSTRRSRQQRKVLVVSARDPKGRVIYMGASCRDDLGLGLSGQFFPRASLSGRQQRRHHHQPLSAKPSTDPADEALSVKKSAEIAALFTNVNVSQTTDIIARSTDVTDSSTTAGEDVIYSSLDGQGAPAAVARNRQGMYLSGTSLENSLGYLP